MPCHGPACLPLLELMICILLAFMVFIEHPWRDVGLKWVSLSIAWARSRLSCAAARLVLACGVLALALTGCALHYYDPDTGVEHLWGVGHMRMRVSVPDEKTTAVIRGSETAGFSMGRTPCGGAVNLGWSREACAEVTGEDTSIRLEWPDADLLNVRFGSEPPWPAPGKAKEDEGR